MRTVVHATVAAVSALAPGQALAGAPAIQNALAYSGYESFAAGDRAIVIRGRANFMGSDGTFEYVIEPGGAFKRTIEAPLGDVYSESGAAAWAADWTGMPRTLVSRERQWNQLLTAVLTGAWASDNTSFTVKDVTADGGATTFEISHPEGPTRALLEIDGDSGAPLRLTYKSVQGTEEWTFEGERSAEGIRVPLRLRRDLEELENTFEVESVALVAGRNSSAYATLPARPADTAFAGEPAAIEFRRAPTGHLLVKPRIDGKDVGWFIFDTGAGGSTAIDESVIETLGLQRVGETKVMSILGPSLSPVHRAASIELGSVTIEKPVIITFDMSPFAQHFDVPVVGVIGYDLLSRCVAEIDLEGKRLTLHDPATFDRSDLPWQTLQLIDRHPVIAATFEGREGLFKMDVGAAPGPFGNVTFHAPAVARMQLLEGRETQSADVGFGTVNMGKVEWFELNGHRFENPDVVFANPGPGPFADQYTTGNIGVKFLAAFRIVFDYSRDRMALVE